MKVVAKNSKAYYEYIVLDEYTAGLVLLGWQVKSIKNGGMSIKEAYCLYFKDEMWLRGANVAPWKGTDVTLLEKGKRDIKLLLNAKEIQKLSEKAQLKGLTIIPLEVLEDRGKLKLKLGMAQGKKLWDKRAAVKDKEARREIDRVLKGGNSF